ncbi:hypothetical protein [Streptomyces sp. NPDC052721]
MAHTSVHEVCTRTHATQRAEQARQGGKPGPSRHLREEPKTPIQEESGR